ncbi:MAG: hypothetical protein JWO52_3518 [Gammaproteobacteria bacterium]|nr:hypothetical protein [Gammaproteobacteria bacterium]
MVDVWLIPREGGSERNPSREVSLLNEVGVDAHRTSAGPFAGW